MVQSTKLPVTAKTRIGYDDVEDFDYLNSFVEKIKKYGSKKQLFFMQEKQF